jgi:hypothetical protein
MKKLTLLLAVGIGYVLGARAGRARYDQIKNLAFKVKEDPRVQSAASTVADTARQQAPVVADKVTSAASGAASAAAAKSPFGGSSSSRDDELLEQLDPDSTARQENPYPQGDLP